MKESHRSATIINVPGILVGHAQDEAALTGCTVILCEEGAVAGVDQRGGAPGTRETDLLRPMHLVQKINAVLLSGGSAFGLDAASGVVHFLEEKGKGFETGYAKVPIVPCAILYDLNIGRSDIRPDFNMGYQACLNATNLHLDQGNFGAGIGVTVGKIAGIGSAVKSGIGSAGIFLDKDLIVAAIIAVNAFGDVINPSTGQILAGARKPPGEVDSPNEPFHDTIKMMTSNHMQMEKQSHFGVNTVIGVVATNALLSKEEANMVAMMSHDGLARTIRPVHTMFDGDTIFALSTGSYPCDVSTIGAIAAEVVADSVLNAILNAKKAGDLPSCSDLISK